MGDDLAADLFGAVVAIVFGYLLLRVRTEA
jgi:hypothetical protein